MTETLHVIGQPPSASSVRAEEHEAVMRKIAECDRQLAQYRAALRLRGKPCEPRPPALEARNSARSPYVPSRHAHAVQSQNKQHLNTQRETATVIHAGPAPVVADHGHYRTAGPASGLSPGTWLPMRYCGLK